MVNDIISNAIEQEVEKRISDILETNEKLKLKCERLGMDNSMLRGEILRLNKLIGTSNLLQSFTSNINIDNIEEIIISNLGFKCERINFDGMNSERIPEWFKILANYNSHKEYILQLFELFNIEYPEWAINVTIPTYYSKDELLLCLEKTNQLYVCNGQICSGNMGFYYLEHMSQKFNLTEVFKKSSYVQIPFQLLLKNRLLIEDEEVFDELVNVVENGRTHSEYFLKINDYQDLPTEKVLRLLNPKKHDKSLFKGIFKKHPELLKDREIGNMFRSSISDYYGSEFYVLRFNKDIQKNYFLKHEFRGQEYVDIISKSDVFTKEEKAELVKQCFLIRIKS